MAVAFVAISFGLRGFSLRGYFLLAFVALTFVALYSLRDFVALAFVAISFGLRGVGLRSYFFEALQRSAPGRAIFQNRGNRPKRIVPVGTTVGFYEHESSWLCEEKPNCTHFGN